MKIFRVILLILILWNIPSIALYSISPGLGGLLSLTTIGLLLFYYLLEKKTIANWWLIIIALFYFTISSFQYYYETKFIVNDVLKYFVVIIAGYELIKKVSKEELLLFIFIGSISIVIDAIVFPTKFGRYSGFYLNPNEAGFICIYGYALIFSIKNTSIKLLGQFVFTLMGLLTFSRTFIVIWLIINIISLKVSLKNIKIIGVGILIFSSLIFIDETIGLNNPRFEQLKNIVNNKNVSSQKINEDSRVDTWIQFYDKILESPIFGSGYGTFSGKTGALGAHNSYLMIIGEAGIIPFMLFLGYICYLFYWSLYLFKKSPYLLMQTSVIAMFLLTDHNFFNFYHVLFVVMWVQYQIVAQRKLINEDLIEKQIIKT